MKDQEKREEQLINELVELRKRLTELKTPEGDRSRARQAIVGSRAWLTEASMFILLCVLVWLNEVLDLPHLLLGAPRTPINWREAIMETVLIAAIGILAVLRLVRDITARQRAEEVLRQRQLQLSILNRLGVALAGTLELERVCRIAFEHVTQLVDCPCFGISLYDPTTRTLRAEFMLSDGELIDAARFPSMVVDMDTEPTRGRVRAIATRQPEIIADSPTVTEGADVLVVGAPGDNRTVGSAMYVPMVVRGEVTGLLEVQSPRVNAYGAEETALLGPVANQIGLGIENARLYQAEQERRHIAETLRQASTGLSSSLELDEVLGLILQQLRQVIPYDSASVQRLQGERLEVVACHGFQKPDMVMGLVFPPDPKFPNYRVVTTKAVLAVEDIAQDYPHFKDEADTYESGRIGSWLGAPLMVKDEIIGMIAVDRAEVHPYTGEESQLAMAFANQAAVAMENARLYEQARQEIAERKRAAVSLEESEKQLQTLIDAMPDFVCFKDGDGRWLKVNDAGIRIFQLEGIDYRGKKDSELAELNNGLQGTFLTCKETDARAWKQGGPIHGEETVPDSDGSVRVFDVTKVPVSRSDGERKGLVVLGHDITERKRAEEALREYSERLEEMVEERTQELRDAQEQLVRQEKLAVLGQLAGAMAHELRNPLGAISNAAYFLNMITEEPKPEVKEMLEIMEKEVRTSERIISSLLDFARPKPPIRRIVDVNEVVRETLSRAAVPDNVEVVSQLEEPLLTVLADPDQLVQVFGNLIINAVQVMTLPSAAGIPDGGRLTVRTALDRGMGGERDTGTGRQGNYLPMSPSPCLRVSISDTGEGISEENMGKLFEPLFTTKAKGIGLGLALVKMLVEANGGSIEVESEVGKGSTFTVRLQIADCGLRIADCRPVLSVVEGLRIRNPHSDHASRLP